MAKHHYVPQFYLKNFSISNMEGYVYAYQRNKKVLKTKTSSIAAKNNLYIFTDNQTGTKNDSIEKMFAYLESIVSPIFTRIIKSDYINLTNEDKSAISEFIAFLYVRNLSFRTKMKNLYSETAKQILAVTASNREAFTHTIKKAGLDIESGEEIEKLRQFAINKEYNIRFNGDDYFLGISLDAALNIGPIIFYKEWVLLKTTGSRLFVTSDNPVSLIRPKGLPSFYGVGFLNWIIALPVSPEHCLVLKNNKSKKKVIDATRRIVEVINWHTFFYAKKFVFSNILSKDIQNMFDKTKEGTGEKVLVN